MPAPARTPLDRTKFGAAAALLSLPHPVQRALSGRPAVQLDGQTLDPEMQLLLALNDLQPGPEMIERPPPAARAKITKDAKAIGGPPIAVGRVDDLTVAGAEGRLRARRYVPERYAAPGPALVYYHGGGFVVGDLDTHDQTCRFLAAHSGVMVIGVDYRLAPEHQFPAAVDDAVAAFRDIQARAADHGADPDRIAVGGDSAGGHLAAVTSRLTTIDGGPAPAFQLLLYPVTDNAHERPSVALFADGFFLTRAEMHWYTAHFLPPGTDREDPRVSPLWAEDLAGLPPAYVATAGFDPLRDEGEAYAEKLRGAGVPTTLRRHPGLIHGFANMIGAGRSARLALAEAAGALQQALKP